MAVWTTLAVTVLAWTAWAGSAAAATKTWNGTATLWSDPNGWTPAGVPTGTDDVVIDSGTPEVSAGDAAAGSIALADTASLTISTDRTLTIGTTNASSIAGNVFLPHGNLRLNGTTTWSAEPETSWNGPGTERGAAATVEARVRGPDGTRTVTYAVHVRPISGRPRFWPAIDGASRTPIAGRPWSFVVRGADGAGRGIRATAVVRVLVRGRVVDTLGWFSFTGALHRTYRWSPTLRGRHALLQASVVGPGGTHTVGYVVRVR